MSPHAAFKDWQVEATQVGVPQVFATLFAPQTSPWPQVLPQLNVELQPSLTTPHLPWQAVAWSIGSQLELPPPVPQTCTKAPPSPSTPQLSPALVSHTVAQP